MPLSKVNLQDFELKLPDRETELLECLSQEDVDCDLCLDQIERLCEVFLTFVSVYQGLKKEINEAKIPVPDGFFLRKNTLDDYDVRIRTYKAGIQKQGGNFADISNGLKRLLHDYPVLKKNMKRPLWF